MDYYLTLHAKQRMRQRHITIADIESALSHINSTYPTPQGSTCIVGSSTSRKQLKLWIVGTYWPQQRRLTIKSVAWREDS